MNGWAWVLWGYGIVATALLAYTWSLLSRTRAAQRRLDDLQ